MTDPAIQRAARRENPALGAHGASGTANHATVGSGAREARSIHRLYELEA